VLAAACAGFIGYKAFQLKKSYETEQMLRLEAEQSASDIQAQLDKLQLDYDRQSDQLKDTSQQLDDAHSQQNDASGQLADVSSRLERAEADLAELTAMLDEGYGFASPQYYASKGVVVVGQHSSETITIYEDYSEENTYTYHTPNSGVSCTWNGSFSNGSTTLTITGNTPGYYSVSFTNDLNSDSFEVLVIVTE
ncbi:MAG: hypothetical protein K2O45_01220, partial [Oscillospiraceae bacterium]|nr:hypothetical protein [Oscillospiraceae bacterium]